MIDLPLLMDKHEQIVAEHRMALLDISSYPHIAEDGDREQVFERLRAPLMRGEEDDDKFDAEGFAALRARLTGG
ncbi:hypothetical protein [Cohnella yongneupensis]|uniref:hypothetical protein n=1 Tax=Cohnella yongneupensis TaxID=425006 RepID=UPI00366E8C56